MAKINIQCYSVAGEGRQPRASSLLLLRFIVHTQSWKFGYIATCQHIKSAKRHIFWESVFLMQMTTHDYHDYSIMMRRPKVKTLFRSLCAEKESARGAFSMGLAHKRSERRLRAETHASAHYREDVLEERRRSERKRFARQGRGGFAMCLRLENSLFK